MAEGLGDTAQVGAHPPFEENLQVGGHGSDEENMSTVRLLLVERMDPDFGLLDKLLQLGALTYPETVQIRGEKSIFDRNAKVLELVFNKMKHQALLTSLTETGQKHLFNLVTGNGGYRAEYGTVWPLGERKTQILDVNRINLVDKICPSELVTSMFSNGVINYRQQEYISSLCTLTEKAGALLDILRRGSEEYYYKTITCLRESKQGHVAELLLEGGVLARVHVSNEGETEQVNEEEDRILEAFKALLQNTTSPQLQRMRVLLDLQIMGATKGQSIVFYIYCKNLEELLYLYELLTKGEFKRCIAAIFDLLISKRETTVSAVNWSEEEFTRFKAYFDAKHLHDEKAVKQQQQQSPDPPKQREAAEERRGDEDVVSQMKSLKVGGRDKVETDVSKIELTGMATEENWEEIIRTNYTELLENIDTESGLYGELQKERTFTTLRLRSYTGYTDTRNKIDRMLRNLLKKDFESFKKFCEALNNSGQEHIVRKYLSKVPTTDSPFSEDTPDYRPISDGMRKCLKQHWNNLIAKITFDEGLLAQVESRQILTTPEINKLKDIQSEGYRTEKVLGWLKYGSEQQFLDFCEALKDNNQLHLVKQYLTPKIPDIDRDPEGMSKELPTEAARGVFPTRRKPRREESYTVFPPDEKKRQTIQRRWSMGDSVKMAARMGYSLATLEADEEARKHEEYMKANLPHYNYIGKFASVGGGEFSSGASSEAVTQRKLPAQRPKLTPAQRSQKYRQEEKLRKEREFEQVKQTARQKTNENEKREKEREERLRADERRARAELLDRIQGKSSGNTPGSPADVSSSASGPSASASGGVKEGSEMPEFDDGLMQLENMFPSVEKSS